MTPLIHLNNECLQKSTEKEDERQINILEFWGGKKKKRNSLLRLPVSTENEEGKGHTFHCQQTELSNDQKGSNV